MRFLFCLLLIKHYYLYAVNSGSNICQLSNIFVGENQISAFGGKGGFGTTVGCGGNGGLGRIRVDAAIFKGSVSKLQGVFSQSALQNEYVVRLNICISSFY